MKQFPHLKKYSLTEIRLFWSIVHRYIDLVLVQTHVPGKHFFKSKKGCIIPRDKFIHNIGSTMNIHISNSYVVEEQFSTFGES